MHFLTTQCGTLHAVLKQNLFCPQCVGVGSCGQDSSPRVHLVAFRLLQLSSIAYITASPTFCSGTYRRMLQHAWSPEYVSRAGSEGKMEWSGPKIEWAGSERWAEYVWENHGVGADRGAGGSWSGEQTKLATQISLKGDASLLKLPKSVLPDVKY